MSIAEQVRRRIKRRPPGTVITLGDFREFPNKKAVALVLSRLKRAGEIERLEKGRYYVPRKSKFGILGPSDHSIVKALIKGDESGYISGIAAYNKLGLTTQVASEITIAGKRFSRKTTIGKLRVRYVKRKTPYNKKESALILQILDAVNDMKRIPDISTGEAVVALKKIIQKLSLPETKELTKASLYYRPAVRAIIGEILDERGVKEVEKLRSSINPLTVFKLNISKKIMPLKEKWNLI